MTSLKTRARSTPARDAMTVCWAAAIVRHAAAAAVATCSLVTFTSAAARSLDAFAVSTLALRKPKSIGSHETRPPTAVPHTLLRELVPWAGPEMEGITDWGSSKPKTLL